MFRLQYYFWLSGISVGNGQLATLMFNGYTFFSCKRFTTEKGVEVCLCVKIPGRPQRRWGVEGVELAEASMKELVGSFQKFI